MGQNTTLIYPSERKGSPLFSLALVGPVLVPSRVQITAWAVRVQIRCLGLVSAVSKILLGDFPVRTLDHDTDHRPGTHPWAPPVQIKKAEAFVR